MLSFQITADEQEKAMEMFRGYSVAVSTRSRVSLVGFEGARAALLALGFMSTPREMKRASRHTLSSSLSTVSSRIEFNSCDPLFQGRTRGLMAVLDSAHKLASGEGAPYDLCQTLKTLQSVSDDNRGPILQEILMDTLRLTQMRLNRENQLLQRWPEILTNLLTAAAVPKEPPELPQL
ncbi:unnamed protein product [Schistocephalus solidus]|uniref:NR LBD domain-containing protein n=1 Tax=Schistocephalus solidus TaxID=70667 RepID=A0A183SM24_SCHSO|nr:unnamed protein product [Schistocephalus solidus]